MLKFIIAFIYKISCFYFWSSKTIRKGLGFCVAMILGFAAFDEEKDPGYEGHDAVICVQLSQDRKIETRIYKTINKNTDSKTLA